MKDRYRHVGTGTVVVEMTKNRSQLYQGHAIRDTRDAGCGSRGGRADGILRRAQLTSDLEVDNLVRYRHRVPQRRRQILPRSKKEGPQVALQRRRGADTP